MAQPRRLLYVALLGGKVVHAGSVKLYRDRGDAVDAAVVATVRSHTLRHKIASFSGGSYKIGSR